MSAQAYQPQGEYSFPEYIKQIIIDNGTRVVMEPEIIFQYPGENSEYLYYIEQGKVLLGIWSDKGDERLIEILGPNNFCAAASVLAGIPDRIFLQTDSPCVIYKIKYSTVIELIHDSKEFRDMLVKYLGTILIRMTILVEGITFLNCKERILELLRISANKENTINGVWHPTRYPYSHSDIARIVGSSRPTVSRLLTELYDEEQVRTVNRTIQVKL